jgi:hypothetical protein
MAMAELNTKSEICNIQREMARARRQIHDDVGGAIDGVQTLTDWRTIVRGHPWLSLGIAAAIGYLVVPRRFVTRLGEPAETRLLRDAPVKPAALSATRSSDGGKWAFASSAFAVISPIALRVAQSYALRYIDNWLGAHAFPSAAQEPGRPAGQSGSWTFSAATSPEGSRETSMHG